MLYTEGNAGLKSAVPKMSYFLAIGLRTRKTGRLSRKRTRKLEAKNALKSSIIDDFLQFPSLQK